MARRTYSDSGFNGFFSRSIAAFGSASNLPDNSTSVTQGNSREVNYDNSPTTGSLGSKLQIGSIILDGNNAKISVMDGTNEVVRIGELDG